MIPIVGDDYCDPEFGTGCVKITPAHDFNDYEVGKRHAMPLINILDQNAAVLAKAQVFNIDGSVNSEFDASLPEAYAGMDRFAARKQIVADFDALGLLEKIEPHALKVPKGDRSGVVIEPWLTDQWYVSTKPLAEPATSRTGVSPASSGGATASQPGTTRLAMCMSAATRPKCAPNTTWATHRCARTKTYWIPGSAPACGPSQPWAGPNRPKR